MDEPMDYVDYEYEQYLKLKGEKKHFCPDWDFMAIDEFCPEFEACTCTRFKSKTSDA
jgi:hypothetical protein